MALSALPIALLFVLTICAGAVLVSQRVAAEEPGLAVTAAALAVFVVGLIILPRNARVFSYSSLFAGLCLLGAGLLGAVGADLLLDAAGWASSTTTDLGAIARAVVVILGGAAVAVLGLKRWSLWTGLPRLVDLRDGEEGASRLRSIMTWNVFLRAVASERIGDNDAKDVRARRLADPAKSPLKKHDVVCLQEFVASGNFRVHQLVDSARAMGFSHAVTPSSPPILSPALADSGLVVLSRVPISRLKHTRLRGAIGPDRFMAKGVDSLILDAKPEPVGLVHAHLQSSYKLRDDPQTVRSRDRQVAQLAAEWKTLRASRRLLCGDLNIDGRDEHDHSALMSALGAPPDADLLLGDKEPRDRPATVAVTYDRQGEEVAVNFYPRTPLAAKGETHVDRSIDYAIATPRGHRAKAIRVPAPDGAPAMSDHRAVVAYLDSKESSKK
jgi:endonuclease/exonuclease/phosphatase family metal-dependent hydrolase